MQSSEVQCIAVKCNNIQYSAVYFGEVQLGAVKNSEGQCSSILLLGDDNIFGVAPQPLQYI